jgi:SNF2 family DNA or RNA helicase
VLPLGQLSYAQQAVRGNGMFTVNVYNKKVIVTAWFRKPQSFVCPFTGKYIADSLEEESYQEPQPWIEAPPIEFEHVLLPEQIAPTRSAMLSLLKNRRALLAWDTGTGKTYAALVMAHNLRLPTLVVCPKAVVYSWQKVAHEIQLKSYLKVVNIEKLRLSKTEYWNEKEGWKLQNWLIILDEAHICGGTGTLQAKVAESIADTDNHTIWLSATLAKSITRLKAFSKVFGLRTGGWNAWLHDNGARFDRSLSRLVISPVVERKSLQNIHKQVFPQMGTRLRMSDMPLSFPPGKVEIHCADMSSVKIAEQYEELAQALQKGTEKLQIRALYTHVMQNVELLKAAYILEMTKQFLEEEKSVAIFVQFRETVRVLQNALSLKGNISGDTPIEERNTLIERFNKDLDHCIVCNIKAGGVGISLHGNKNARPRIALICPHPDADVLKQALGRVHRADGAPNCQYILFAQNTPEQKIATSLQQKLTNMATFNGDAIASWIEEGFASIVERPENQ